MSTIDRIGTFNDHQFRVCVCVWSITMNGYIATNGPLPSTNGHGTIVANGGATLMLTTPAMASGSAGLGQMTYYNPRHHNGQPMPPQVSVVIGTGPHSTTYPPNKCCLACCLAPLWYGQCNIYRVRDLIIIITNTIIIFLKKYKLKSILKWTFF